MEKESLSVSLGLDNMSDITIEIELPEEQEGIEISNFRYTEILNVR